MKYTSSGFAGGSLFKRIRDTVYLSDCPEIADTHRVNADFETVRHRFSSQSGIKTFFDLSMSYGAYVSEHRSEPPYMSFLTDLLKSRLREIRLLEECSIFPGALHYGGFRVGFHDKGIVEDSFHSTRVWRLFGIGQLGYIHDAGGQEQAGMTVLRFTHTRFNHVAQVYALAGLVSANLKLSSKDAIHFVIAGLLHDHEMPAGGDTIQAIDPKGLDEEANFPRIFGNPKWEEFRKRYSLSNGRLHSIVRGEGTLGKLLDYIDKLGYISLDTYHFLARGFAGGVDVIGRIIAEDPLFCGWWDSIEILNGVPVVRDIDRLARFLRVRALLFRYLYYNPLCRYVEHAATQAAVSLLYREGKITKEELLTKNDEWLEREIVEKFFGVQSFLYTVGGNGIGSIESFVAVEEIIKREREYLSAKSDSILTFTQMFDGKANPAVNSFFVEKGGRIMTFAEARPAEAGAIKTIMTWNAPHKLYVLDLKQVHIDPEAVHKLRDERRKILKMKIV